MGKVVFPSLQISMWMSAVSKHVIKKMSFDKKKGKMEIDMLHGPLFMKILLFALPLAASSLMQQLFNSIDVAVVGHFASREALAAVGSNGPVINLLINLFLGISMGANVIISNHIGQNDRQSIRDAINTIALVSVVSGVLLMIVGQVVARPILELIDTPENVIDLSVVYLRIYFLGIPFFLIFNFAAAILRSIGDTRRPLYILVIAGIVNTVFNLVFVICLDMSVAGVAIATSISNVISAVLIVRILLRESYPYRLVVKEMHIKWEELKRMLQIGVPAGIQGMIFSFSNVLMQSAINGYGAAAIAGSAASLNFESYCYFLVVAFNGAAISFIGQNYGAGDNRRVRRVFWICMGLGMAFCLTSNLLISWQHTLCLSAFSTDPEVLAFGSERILVALATQSIACFYEIPGAALRGMGRSVLPTVITVFGTCLLRIVWIFGVAEHYSSFKVLMAAYPVSWTLTGIMMSVAFYIFMKKLPVSRNA